MSPGRWLAAAGLMLAIFATASAAPPRQPATGADRIVPDMTPDQVRQILGPPNRVARQILYHRYLEQWVYSPPVAVRAEFDRHSGQPARLLSATPDDGTRR
jgi:hypothetical protein